MWLVDPAKLKAESCDDKASDNASTSTVLPASSGLVLLDDSGSARHIRLSALHTATQINLGDGYCI